MKSILFSILLIVLIISCQSSLSTATFGKGGFGRFGSGGFGRGLGGGFGSGGLGGFGGLGGLHDVHGFSRPGFVQHGFSFPGFGSQGLGFGPDWHFQSWGLGWPSGHGIRNGIHG